MENLKTFEGFFRESKHDYIVRKITKYVLENNVIPQQKGGRYVFFIENSNTNPEDPFDEETSKKHKLQVSIDYDDYDIRLNGDTLDSSNSLSKKLCGILRTNKENAEVIMKDQRIKDYLDKISYFKKEE